MFKRKQQSKIKSARDLGNAPPSAFDAARAEWAERNGDNTVNQSRFFVLGALGWITAIVLGFAVLGLAPLKSVVPYSITTDKVTGQTRAVGITAEQYTPSRAQKSYEMATWARLAVGIDPFTLERDIKDSMRRLRGKAIDEYRDFLTSTQPVLRSQKDRTLTRTVELINAPTYLQENVAQLRIKTQERTSGENFAPERYLVTIHFVTEPPKSEEEILDNPVGFYIVHFSIAKETHQ